MKHEILTLPEVANLDAWLEEQVPAGPAGEER